LPAGHFFVAAPADDHPIPIAADIAHRSTDAVWRSMRAIACLAVACGPAALGITRRHSKTKSATPLPERRHHRPIVPKII